MALTIAEVLVHLYDRFCEWLSDLTANPSASATAEEIADAQDAADRSW